mmetsp:Transcript_26240/g.36980  ORF Transcript_26240/g.36980 Transcript_26240/m.36980 type:complete len:837 (+) Transcript_26240:116-2626(+)
MSSSFSTASSSRSLLQSSLVALTCLSLLSSSSAIENPLQVDKHSAGQSAKTIKHVWKNNEDGTAYLPDMLAVDYKGQHPHDPNAAERKLEYTAQGFNNDDFRPLNIHFITDPLERTKTADPNSYRNKNIDAIIDTVLPQIADTWATHLSLDSPQMFLSVANSVCFGFFDDHLPDTVITESPADLVVIVGGDDTLYTSSGLTNPVCGNGVLSTAKACNVDQYERPVIGFINFCVEDRIAYTDRDIVDYTANGVHEMAHVLGFDPTLMIFFRHHVTREPLTPRDSRGRPQKVEITCTDGSTQVGLFPGERILRSSTSSTGLTHHHVVTPKVRQVARNHLNCQSLQGAQLENQPLIATCTGHHWDERLFPNEVMSSVFDGSEGSVLSPLTLALLEDSGWYKVSYIGAKLSPGGHGLGCDFANSPCIVDNSVPDYGKGLFCDTPIELDDYGVVTENNPMYCDASQTKISLCDLWHADDQQASAQLMGHQYFTNADLVSLHVEADFCPMPRIPRIDCTNPIGKRGTSITTYSSEVFGSESKCVNAKNSNGLSRPACMNVECDDTRRKVVVGDYVCQYDGERVNFPNGQGSFECPRVTTMCPHFFCPSGCCGVGTCNYQTGQCSQSCRDGQGFGVPLQGTESPTPLPTETRKPTPMPTKRPTNVPTASPTDSPTESPKVTWNIQTDPPVTQRPTPLPTKLPSRSPTKRPTESPTTAPPTLPPPSRPTLSKQKSSLSDWSFNEAPTEAPQMRQSPEPTKAPTTNLPTVSSAPPPTSFSSRTDSDTTLTDSNTTLTDSNSTEDLTSKTLSSANAEQTSSSSSLFSFGFTKVLGLVVAAGLSVAL